MIPGIWAENGWELAENKYKSSCDRAGDRQQLICCLQETLMFDTAPTPLQTASQRLLHLAAAAPAALPECSAEDVLDMVLWQLTADELAQIAELVRINRGLKELQEQRLLAD